MTVPNGLVKLNQPQEIKKDSEAVLWIQTAEYIKYLFSDEIDAETKNHHIQVLKHLEQNKLEEKPLPSYFSQVAVAIKEGSLISQNQIQQFVKELNSLEKEEQTFYLSLIFRQCLNFFNEIKDEIEKLVQAILTHQEFKAEINETAPIKWKRLINILYVNKYYIFEFVFEECFSCFTLIGSKLQDTLRYEISFAINSLIYTKQISKLQPHTDLDLGKPVYPGISGNVNQATIALKPGIKPSNEYFPLRRVSKLYPGDAGNNTFIAVDRRRKMLFVRNAGEYCAATAVFLSKIATVISKKHFASERRLDNGLSAAKKLDVYQMPAADPSNKAINLLQEGLKTQLSIEGVGLCDEVTNFIQECDLHNLENFGLSKTEKALVFGKIDYDRCSTHNLKVEDYEMDILTTCLTRKNKEFAAIKTTEFYLLEKLTARLKFALFPAQLFEALADKSEFTDPDKFKKSISEMVKRTNMALDLFCQHTFALKFLKQTKIKIEFIYQEIIEYINKHFKKENIKVILEGLADKKQQVENRLLDVLKPAAESKVETHSSAGKAPETTLSIQTVVLAKR